MKRWLLAAVILLGGSVAPACADYVVIIIDLAKKSEPTTQPGMGEPGPMQPRPMQPGYGQRGGGGPMGQPMGGRGQPAAPPAEGEAIVDFDAAQTHLAVVVEFKEPLIKEYQLEAFAQGQPLNFSGTWGKATMVHDLLDGEIKVILIDPKLDNSSLARRFQELKDKAGIRDSGAPPKTAKEKLEKIDASAVLTYADFCLKHGSLKSFTDAMDQFAQTESKHPAAVAYLQVARELAKPTTDPAKNTNRTALLQGYKMVTNADSPHYIAYHREATDEPREVKSRLIRLEKNFKSFYYWYALRGIVLRVPTERQPALVVFNEKEYKQFKEQLTATHDVADGFVARREGLAVFSSKRLDAAYLALEKKNNEYWTKGINRDLILTNMDTAIPNDWQYKRDPKARAYLGELTLLQNMAEIDGERNSVTHNGTRQLLYASGLLPSTVAAPEWLQFGMGSFFETPMESPFVSTGLPNCDYLPLWGDLIKHKQLPMAKEHPSDLDAVETLRLVVTDGYFRQARQDGSLRSLRKARATSWALLYFLAANNKLEGQKPNLEGLQRYCQEMAKMPRDMELDEKVLLNAFCKAFNLLDPGYEANPTKSPTFQDFAKNWKTFLEQEGSELKYIVEEIRKTTKKYSDNPAEGDKVKVNDASLAPQYGGPFHPTAPDDSTATEGPHRRPGDPMRGQPRPPIRGGGGYQP